jgi:hypothetical protein
MMMMMMMMPIVWKFYDPQTLGALRACTWIAFCECIEGIGAI